MWEQWCGTPIGPAASAACADDRATGGDFHCFGPADKKNYAAESPLCDTRQYGIDLKNGVKGCTNARARFSRFSDYSVWPFISDGDDAYSVSGAAYATAVPTGLFVNSTDSVPPSPTLDEFLQKARKRSSTNPYAATKQLYPRMVFPRGSGSDAVNMDGAAYDPYNPKYQRFYYTNLSSMNAFESCQCFSGPLELDGHYSYDSYPDRRVQSDGDLAMANDALQGCTGQGKSDSRTADDTHDWQKCVPKRVGYGAEWRCYGSDAATSKTCYTVQNPQTPGPFPRQTHWGSADIPGVSANDDAEPWRRTLDEDAIVNAFKASGGTPRWWREAYDGLPAVRAGIAAVLDPGTWEDPSAWLSTKHAFSKRLYRVADADTLYEFGWSQLAKFVDIGILDIGDSTDTQFVLPDRTDEAKFYVQTPQRDMCADFGRSDNQTDWAAHALTDDLFEAVVAGLDVEYATEDPAVYWNATGGTDSVCAGNLHGMPGFMPGAARVPCRRHAEPDPSQVYAVRFRTSRRRLRPAGATTLCRAPGLESSCPSAETRRSTPTR